MAVVHALTFTRALPAKVFMVLLTLASLGILLYTTGAPSYMGG